ncbi:MAG: hypothetical protein A2X34_05380 [Elusimicrobia bacterium GWC2_51_8]|nr:MAG: hypothetical protein A2X33_09145 [Elusimicrobia bacterium GWA2_51_34]OGR65443.1 MAG: hypothetical protein A2X34_05380 [Elusimicrobia bacterium GWC2_51_8]OGR84983.1 MAG: hypothetical protein A2021_08355 [Elusimicrobia bacterium GWF2_52_66]HAF95203.1 hypothetical protein [Elusimicrobiota bacterium]HCE97132.1 hypothetical protein [Elusimicrobiota bacterium]
MIKTDRRTFFAMLAISFSGMFLIGGYEFIRVAGDSLFITNYGAAQRPYVMTASPLVTMLCIYIFGSLLTRFGSLWALIYTFIISICIFVLSFVGIFSGIKLSILIFYFFAQSYIVVLFEQFWSFIDSVLKKEEAQSYNGPIVGVISFGPILAGWLIKKTAVSLGTNMVILMGAVSLVPSMLLGIVAYKMAGEPKPFKTAHDGKAPLHLSLFKEQPELLFLAAVIALSQGLSTVVQLNFMLALERAIPFEDVRTAFLGKFWMNTAIISCILQFFVAPYLLKRFSLRLIMLLIPCIHLLIGLAMFGSGSIMTAVLAYGGFKILDYSVFRAGKEIVYIPFSFDVRYRAKQVIDSFVYRFSKGVASGFISLVSIITGSFPQAGYVIMDLVMATGWFAAVFPLTRNSENSEQTKSR